MGYRVKERSPTREYFTEDLILLNARPVLGDPTE